MSCINWKEGLWAELVGLVRSSEAGRAALLARALHGEPSLFPRRERVRAVGHDLNSTRNVEIWRVFIVGFRGTSA